MLRADRRRAYGRINMGSNDFGRTLTPEEARRERLSALRLTQNFLYAATFFDDVAISEKQDLHSSEFVLDEDGENVSVTIAMDLQIRRINIADENEDPIIVTNKRRYLKEDFHNMAAGDLFDEQITAQSGQAIYDFGEAVCTKGSQERFATYALSDVNSTSQKAANIWNKLINHIDESIAPTADI